MDTIEKKLEELGYTLPSPPQPGGSYLPYRQMGNILVLAGVICVHNGEMTHTGQVGLEQTEDSAKEGAVFCALNVLAGIKAAAGGLDQVAHFIYMSGYVNATAGFSQSPQVINGASELFVQLYGDAGKHARAAVAVAGLPQNSTVEIQVNVLLKSQIGE